MLSDDFPRWMQWAVATAQVVGPLATTILAILAFRTAKAAIASAELAKTEFTLSRMPVVLVQDLSIAYVNTRLIVRGAIGVATEGMSPVERVGRRVDYHRVETHMEAWAEHADEMHVVCRKQNTRNRTSLPYDSRLPLFLSDRTPAAPATVSIRVLYTFSSAYAPWYSETWIANATADADETGQLTFGPIFHQFLKTRQYRDSYRWRLGSLWRSYCRRMDQIRREMGG